MYQPSLSSLESRKRDRDTDSDDENGPQGFSEHRIKRPHIANLPLRRSPELRRHFQPQRSPSIADITPAGSDSEDAPITSVPQNEPRSFFSPWSSPHHLSNLPSTQVSPSPAFSPGCSLPDAPSFSDDMEMADPTFSSHSGSNNNFLSIGSSQPDSQAQANSLSGRIPTPIHCQFSSQIRAANDYDYSMSSPSTENYSYTIYGGQDRRRLPSPISEGDSSSPGARYGLHTRCNSTLSTMSDADMTMEVEVTQPLEDMSVEAKSPVKKGHTRSKHSVRAWGGSSSFVSEKPGLGPGPRRGFSMGYRSDCEKCRMKVPGHFSHIITY